MDALEFDDVVVSEHDILDGIALRLARPGAG
jgi:exopolyphosphatase/guanosine-5'-triphosphate,3'-diphosphate pyrophosphatase